MAHVSLEGTHRRAPGKNLMAALELDAVAHHRARGMAFQQRDRLGVEPAAFVGGAQRAQLAVHIRHQQAAGAAIVAQPHAPDQAINAVSCGQGIVQALQDDGRSPLAGDETIGMGIEGPALGAG